MAEKLDVKQGTLALMILKTIVNFIALALRTVGETTWGKLVYLAIALYVVVWIFRNANGSN